MTPTMIHAQGFLDRVAAVAPTKDARRTLSKAYAQWSGREPRTLFRAIDRAEERAKESGDPTVSAKVADSFHAFLLENSPCERCGRWFPREGRNTLCGVCRVVPPRNAGAG